MNDKHQHAIQKNIRRVLMLKALGKIQKIIILDKKLKQNDNLQIKVIIVIGISLIILFIFYITYYVNRTPLISNL